MLSRKLQSATAAAVTAWNVANAEYNGTPFNKFYVGLQDTFPRGIFFKDDGTKMYVLGSTGDDVNEYNLSVAWDISTASYLQNFSIATEEIDSSGIFFKPDGTKMYVVGTAGDDVNEYNLSTAWNISTASYVQNFSVAAQETLPRGIFFKDDGTKLYIIGTAAGQNVNEYSLSTAWNISTASYVQNFSVAAQDTTPVNISFKSDGTKMYVLGDADNDVNEYSLSTAWNISTASYVQNFSVAAQESSLSSLFFKGDGTKLYICGVLTDSIYTYDLSTAWNISTASWISPTTNYFSVLTQEESSTGISFKADGTKMYVIGSVGQDVNEYSLSTAWNISTASYVQNFSVAAQETNPQDLFFKPDGTKMYVVGNAGDDINEYNLSTAWNISTASYVQNFSVAAQDTFPTAVFFKDDGTKMYVLGDADNDVNEYNLSTAWNISTASYVQNFSVAAQDTFPTAVFFKDDGTKMYVIGSVGQDVNEYNLSTAWNISTASYVQNFSVAAQETNPRGLFFKDDGTKMYVIGINGINQYNLSTAWNISTASYSQNFSTLSQDGSMSGLFFKNDGTKMYSLGGVSDAVWSYDI